MARVVLGGVKKVYAGGVEAVQGVSIDIADGEFIVLVGPSGCGKSTLLRMVAGLETVTEGTITIGGRVVNQLEPAERDIAMVFQNYALYPHMSVRENLSYGLRNRKVAKPDIERRIAEAARILEIGALLDRKPRQLSGGQRQRVAMGRAIVREPAAFLFDEPLSNLDAKLRVQMRTEIRRLHRSLGVTSLYVTHDQLEAMTLADRLVVMNGGRIEQIGAPMDLYEKPASTFVAGFIGSPAMNLLPAGAAILPGPPAGRGGAMVGVRPHDMALVDEPADEGLTLRLTVTSVEPVGAETFVYGEPAGGGPDVGVRVPGHRRFDAGTPITAFAPTAALHFFDEAGQRIR